MSNNNKRKRYFPNRLNHVMRLSDDDLEPTPFDVVMEDAGGWELIPNVVLLTRLKNAKTGKVTELAFADEVTADRILRRLLKRGDYQVDQMSHEAMLTGYTYDPNETAPSQP